MNTATSARLTVTEEFAYRACLQAPVEFGSGPFGTRIFFGFDGGRVEGERIKADVLGSGGDWILVGPDGMGRIDVRGQWRTDDGAAIYVHYTGLVEMNEAVGTALATGGSTHFDDQYLRMVPRFETGDERYSWLHRTMFVGRGRIADGAAAFTVFRVD